MRISYYNGNIINDERTATQAEAYCRFYDGLETFGEENCLRVISETFSNGVSIQLWRGKKQREYFVIEHYPSSAAIYRYNNRMWAEQKYHSAINVQLMQDERTHESDS